MLLIKCHNKVENTNNIYKQRTISIFHKREVASELLRKYSHPFRHWAVHNTHKACVVLDTSLQCLDSAGEQQLSNQEPFGACPEVWSRMHHDDHRNPNPRPKQLCCAQKLFVHWASLGKLHSWPPVGVSPKQCHIRHICSHSIEDVEWRCPPSWPAS